MARGSVEERVEGARETNSGQAVEYKQPEPSSREFGSLLDKSVLTRFSCKHLQSLPWSDSYEL